MERDDDSGLESELNSSEGINIRNIFLARMKKKGYLPTKEQLDGAVHSYSSLAPADGRYSEKILNTVLSDICSAPPVRLPLWLVSVIDYTSRFF